MACCIWRNGWHLAGPSNTEVRHVRRHRSRRSPPRRPRLGTPPRDQLWNLLTSEQRRRTLTTLSGLVVRLLDASRDEQDVCDEPS